MPMILLQVKDFHQFMFTVLESCTFITAQCDEVNSEPTHAKGIDQEGMITVDEQS